jgi:hypothetical protein
LLVYLQKLQQIKRSAERDRSVSSIIRRALAAELEREPKTEEGDGSVTPHELLARRHRDYAKAEERHLRALEARAEVEQRVHELGRELTDAEDEGSAAERVPALSKAHDPVAPGLEEAER